jgi:hypothetical protein
MRIFSIVILVLALATTMLGGGCPKQRQAGEAIATPEPAAPSTADQAGQPVPQGEPLTTEPDEPEAVESDEEAAPEGETSGKPAGDSTTADLTGQWLGLFGRANLGVIESAWKDGVKVEFQRNGKAIWKRIVQGQGAVKAQVGAEATLESRWQLVNNRLIIHYSKVEAAKLGFGAVAPLGMLRDEEIGLLSQEQDGALGVGISAVDERLEFIVEPNYLTLTDKHGHLMVYGRVDRDSGSRYDFTGKWVGHIDMHDNFGAVFNWDGQNLTATYDHNGGSFEGVLVDGFFVGKARDTKGMSLAALTFDGANTLDGAYCPDPYMAMYQRYDFNRSR